MLTTLKLITTQVPAPTTAGTPSPASMMRLKDPESIRSDGLPLVTIISVVSNDQKTLNRTIESIRSQTYPAIELICIDPGSSGVMLEVIKSHTDTVSAYAHIPSNGFYDAINKGIVSAHGEIIGVLKAGDWLEPDYVERAINTLTDSAGDFVFGDLCTHCSERSSSEASDQDLVLVGDPDYGRVVQRDVPRVWLSGMLCRKFVYDRVGLFRTDMKFASDYDFQIRAFNAGFCGVHSSGALVHGAGHELSKRERRRSTKESFASSVRHGYPVYKAIPHWAMRWIVSEYPGAEKHQNTAVSTLRSMRSSTARGAKKAWDVFGPLKPYLPGKRLAMKVLGVSPLDHRAPVTSVALAADSAHAEISHAPVGDTERQSETSSVIEAKPVLAQDASDHIQGNVQLAAFIEARHAGIHLPDRAIEAMIQRAGQWDWFAIRGDHKSAPAFEAMFRVLGVKKVSSRSDQSALGLIIDFQEQHASDHRDHRDHGDHDAVMILDDIPPHAVKLGDQGMCLIRGTALSAAR